MELRWKRFEWAGNRQNPLRAIQLLEQPLAGRAAFQTWGRAAASRRKEVPRHSPRILREPSRRSTPGQLAPEYFAHCFGRAAQKLFPGLDGRRRATLPAR